MEEQSREQKWASLMRSGLAGQESAYRSFLELVTPHLRATVSSRCRNFRASEGDVEDIVQEVLITLHLKRHTWDTSRPISPWLNAVAHNKMIDAFRRRYRHHHIPLDDVAEGLFFEETGDSYAGQDIEKMLEKLKENERVIVRSISLDECSVREVAIKLKMSDGAIRVALHRALKQLAKHYRYNEL
ncbi:MAG: sigma-70 family RNA polymerase sigma factor [Gammaproteobacteria bacterium]|nr:sigma-70 family RNA polymerase sigma factor [Gammaproteobacteria bacterium]